MTTIILYKSHGVIYRWGFGEFRFRFPLYHARTPATSDSASGQYVDDIILAGIVNKNPKI